MLKLRQILIILATPLFLSGCMTIANAISPVKPVCVSKDDSLTDGTAQQIVTLDETLGKPCKK